MLLSNLPAMSRPLAAIELSVWGLMAVPMGMLSGGVAGVVANTAFAGAAPAWVLGVAVALLTGAGPLANMGSIAWAHWSQGRGKVRALRRLQLAFAACLLVAAGVPLNAAGLGVLVAALLAAQVLWCGIITIRAAVWRLNYTRVARTVFAARNQAIVSLVTAGVAALTGWLVGLDADAFRGLLVLTSLCVLASFLRFRSVRPRRERRLLAAERELNAGRAFSPRTYLEILREDSLYRRYMLWMMVLGSGNLMLTAPLILILANNLGVASFDQVLITATLPTLVVPFATNVWARSLARQHVIRFRSRNSRWYACGSALMLAGVASGYLPVLWLAAVVLGIGIGGGTLGWTLGHNDFAAEERAGEYLGLHVSLTGIRGLLAPLVGVGLYGLLERAAPGAGAWALALPLALTTTGALGFTLLHRQLAAAGFPVDQPSHG